jgi:pimeloyl-ACP methyl ester carboxylesterase
VPPRAFAADLAAAASWPAGRRELARIELPVTVVSGSSSSPVRRESAAALARLLPDAELVEVGAGHLAHVEAPAEVAAAIARAV